MASDFSMRLKSVKLQDRKSSYSELTLNLTRIRYANEEAMNIHLQNPDVVFLIQAIEAEGLFSNIKIVYTGPKSFGYTAKL
jgi:hypothetical protein